MVEQRSKNFSKFLLNIAGVIASVFLFTTLSFAVDVSTLNCDGNGTPCPVCPTAAQLQASGQQDCGCGVVESVQAADGTVIQCHVSKSNQGTPITTADLAYIDPVTGMTQQCDLVDAVNASEPIMSFVRIGNGLPDKQMNYCCCAPACDPTVNNICNNPDKGLCGIDSCGGTTCGRICGTPAAPGVYSNPCYQCNDQDQCVEDPACGGTTTTTTEVTCPSGKTLCGGGCCDTSTNSCRTDAGISKTEKCCLSAYPYVCNGVCCLVACDGSDNCPTGSGEGSCNNDNDCATSPSYTWGPCCNTDTHLCTQANSIDTLCGCTDSAQNCTDNCQSCQQTGDPWRNIYSCQDTNPLQTHDNNGVCCQQNMICNGACCDAAGVACAFDQVNGNEQCCPNNKPTFCGGICCTQGNCYVDENNQSQCCAKPVVDGKCPVGCPSGQISCSNPPDGNNCCSSYQYCLGKDGQNTGNCCDLGNKRCGDQCCTAGKTPCGCDGSIPGTYPACCDDATQICALGVCIPKGTGGGCTDDCSANGQVCCGSSCVAPKTAGDCAGSSSCGNNCTDCVPTDDQCGCVCDGGGGGGGDCQSDCDCKADSAGNRPKCKNNDPQAITGLPQYPCTECATNQVPCPLKNCTCDGGDLNGQC